MSMVQGEWVRLITSLYGRRRVIGQVLRNGPLEFRVARWESFIILRPRGVVSMGRLRTTFAGVKLESGGQ